MTSVHTNLLLDCDGIIVNSEEICEQAEITLIASLGLDLSPKEYRDIALGQPEDRYVSELVGRLASAGLPPAKSLQARLRDARWKAYEENLHLIPGMRDLIDQHKASISIVSSSDLYSVRRKLQLVGLVSIPDDRIFASEPNHNTKATTYLAALKSLGVTAESCIAVEDSTVGISAARKAGVEVWGLIARNDISPGLSQSLLRSGASKVYSDTKSLKDALAVTIH